jgi:hypothetical protein
MATHGILLCYSRLHPCPCHPPTRKGTCKCNIIYFALRQLAPNRTKLHVQPTRTPDPSFLARAATPHRSERCACHAVQTSKPYRCHVRHADQRWRQRTQATRNKLWAYTAKKQLAAATASMHAATQARAWRSSSWAQHQPAASGPQRCRPQWRGTEHARART